MLQRDLPIRILCARVLDCGQPWHGLSVASELDFGGVDPMAWPQPDSGDCWSVHVPGAAGGTQDPQTNEYHQWLDYGLLSGWWQRQLYGQVLPAGRLSYLYTYGVGHTYVVDITSITFTGDNLGGSLDLHATVASAAPPDTLTLAPDDLDLDAAYTLRDVIAFNADGSQAILGVWPTTYLGETLTYSQAALCRAQARLIYGLHDYRVIPNALVTLDITETAGVLDAALAMLKTPAQMAEHTEDDVFDESGGDPETGEGYYHIAHNYQTWRKIVGAYYRSDGAIAYVVLQYRYTFDWSRLENVGAGTETHTVSLIVNGTTKSTLAYSIDWELQNLGVPIGWAPVRLGGVLLDLDGTGLPANGMTAGTVGGVKPDELDMVASFTLWDYTTPANERDVVIHAIRYSNHAWGLALIGLNTGIHGAGNTAYLGGIVNLLDGSRTANIGYRTVGLVGDALADTYASVQPESLEIEHGHDLMCWV
jgi:hypothetical protein